MFQTAQSLGIHFKKYFKLKTKILKWKNKGTSGGAVVSKLN